MKTLQYKSSTSVIVFPSSVKKEGAGDGAWRRYKASSSEGSGSPPHGVTTSANMFSAPLPWLCPVALGAALAAGTEAAAAVVMVVVAVAAGLVVDMEVEVAAVVVVAVVTAAAMEAQLQ
ncbi:hypothetical protein E2C01_029026 [Portunus trituberculatus]|uniref:Uncharacterized protein n=1 Tax=Portunus trituberculatus TaxID=210409 RepID=A0A5B7EM09_PORTR|nr:hypothetical protein [Portunus trituberculatus]